MPGGSISFSPVQPPGQPPSNSGGMQSVSSGESESGPYAPQYLGQAADVLGQTLDQGKANYTAQAQRLQDFVKQLWNLRSQVMNQAKSAAARGANGQQNPLAVHQAVQELANQAGIPFTAEISKTLMAGNSIENSLTDLMTKIGQTYGQLGSVNQSHSQSQSAGGGVMTLGGNRGNAGGNGQGDGKGIYTDIYGKQHDASYNPGFEGIAWADRQHDINAARDAAATRAGQPKNQGPSADNPITGTGLWNGPNVPNGFFNPQPATNGGFEPPSADYPIMGSGAWNGPNVPDYFFGSKNRSSMTAGDTGGSFTFPSSVSNYTADNPGVGSGGWNGPSAPGQFYGDSYYSPEELASYE